MRDTFLKTLDMSFVSQPDTSHSQRGLSESRPNVQTTPRSKSRSSHVTSIAASDRSKKGSRSPSVASEDSSWPLLRTGGYVTVDGYFATDHDLFRTDHWPYEVKNEHISPVVSEKQCHLCGGRCAFTWFQDPWIPDRLEGYGFPVVSYGTQSMFEEFPWYQFGCTTKRTIEGPHNDEQPSYQNLEDYKRQQASMCKDRIYGEIRNRNKVPTEPSRLFRDRPVDALILEIAKNVDDPSFFLLRYEIETECPSILGHISLKIWRRAAGKNKSWKRCPRSTAPGRAHVRPSLSRFEHQFAKSPLWLPSAFLCSQAKSKSPRLSYVVRRQASGQVPERARYYDPYVHNAEDCSVTPHRRYCTTTMTHDKKAEKSGPVVIEDIGREPAGAFIRFTWKDNVLANAKGQLDRFLPPGHVFRSGWCVVDFLRNESHTDVYSLSSVAYGHSSVGSEVSQEAHVFLDEYYGNCANYARRLKSRMRESGDCLESFWYGGRHVFIMEIQRKPILFRLRNTEEDFPILVDQNKCSEQVALQRRHFRGKPSFAAVVGDRRPRTEFVHRPTLMPESKSALEKELQQIEKARLKKAERQRMKRQLQRDKRIAEKAQSIEVAVEEK